MKSTPEEAAACKVVTLLMKSFGQGSVFAAEVPFASQTRRADLVVIGSKSYGIEVKSERDDIYSAITQLDDYLKVFDYTIIASTRKQVAKIYDQLSKYVGIIEINDNGAEWRRRPIHRKKKDPAFVASWLDKKTLIEVLRENCTGPTKLRSMLVGELRSLATSKISIERLQEVALFRLHNRAVPVFESFKMEVGSVCLPEDLCNLRYREMPSYQLDSS